MHQRLVHQCGGESFEAIEHRRCCAPQVDARGPWQQNALTCDERWSEQGRESGHECACDHSRVRMHATAARCPQCAASRALTVAPHPKDSTMLEALEAYEGHLLVEGMGFGRSRRAIRIARCWHLQGVCRAPPARTCENAPRCCVQPAHWQQLGLVIAQHTDLSVCLVFINHPCPKMGAAASGSVALFY